MTTSHTWSRLYRWGILSAALLIGATLMATVWTARSGVQEASATLIRGQSQVLEESIRSRLLQMKRKPTQADLDDMMDELADEGLRYLLVLGNGGAILAQAGDASAPVEELAAIISAGRGGVPVVVGDRIRVVRKRARRPGRRQRRARNPGRVGNLGPYLIEFEPVIAGQLEDTSNKSLVVGASAAGSLLLIALVLFVRIVRRERGFEKQERERRLANLGQMSAVLAHEIRNPLASLKGNAQLLARALPEGEKPRAKADRVVEEAIRLERLSNDLLDFAKTASVERATVDPSALVTAVAESVAPEAVSVDSSRAPKSWSLDEFRMRQVLVNLFENAVQAGAPVAAHLSHDRGRLRIVIADSGPGIDDGELDKLFEPFYTRKTRGTGLGLAVAKRLVELHGGSLTAHNRPGGGAEFVIEIPAG